MEIGRQTNLQKTITNDREGEVVSEEFREKIAPEEARSRVIYSRAENTIDLKREESLMTV